MDEDDNNDNNGDGASFLSFVRLSARHDLGPAVKELLSESWDVSSLSLTPESLAASGTDPARCDSIVALLGAGQVVAHACTERDDDSDTVHVTFVCVAHRMRKRGFGRLLMAHVEVLAREQQCKRVALECDSRDVQMFYARCGYVVTGHTPPDCVAMAKAITP